ncbi:hypothetical protein F4553_005827 [Allocatelliglobosispora scoriae]|uniref:DUF4190 domain-containing protein n=1 Tax=Allocatelliglobosispora scoriae TaxID=643052 RepID=A0A841BZS8_9ACTN|nr:DUF4190 domain-containing protein [Allocatelliglobosispora scoriae]MBB5872393.1 hypothetical protein [Allocatelliglobosispora scoriae]
MTHPQPPSDPYGQPYQPEQAPYQPYGAPPPQDPYAVPPQQPYGAPAYGPPAYGTPPYGSPQNYPDTGQQQYGAPVSPYPQYGEPQQPYLAAPAPYQPVAPLQNPKVNGFAIASLIFGICGGLLFSTIFGIIALVQIKRHGGRGKGMAVAGLVLTVLWVAVIGVGVALSANYTPTTSTPTSARNSAGAVTTPGTVKLTTLKKGDCIDTSKIQEGVEFSTVPAVPCNQPHDAEIYAIFSLTGSTWPGDAKVADLAETGCTTRMKTFLPSKSAQAKYDIFFIHPAESGWIRGDRSVSCLATALPGKKLNAPIKP